MVFNVQLWVYYRLSGSNTEMPVKSHFRQLRRWPGLSPALYFCSMNTTLSGSGRVDDIKGHPQGELRGLTKFAKITEDVRKFAAEQGVTDDHALHNGMEQKAREFKDSGAEIYTKS